jgi:hypothetical protein
MMILGKKKWTIINGSILIKVSIQTQNCIFYFVRPNFIIILINLNIQKYDKYRIFIDIN